ncbi:ribosome maturation factor RimM [Pseudohoeflea suaedae]|uniref:Ribosome maturation factor RimM n=1 Tax=Pseudohoeflea suaedae TaxID=877384 RepID=A0A4R5PLB2_9HYPH|nr:ribosome maturation factor RimM [Pseudohoeflea suaedae]TDH37724.1 ribosome maturation factor RimM [Pseudohoeflea suaedae]
MKSLLNPVLVGVIGAPQGIRGELRVKPYTDEPTALAGYGVLHDAKGERYEVLSARPNGNVVVLRLMGVNDRNQAEAMRGIELFVDRSSLPDDELEEDEFFHADLEGLEAFDAEGRSWGVITAIFDFGGGDLLELRGANGKSVVIPFSLAAVPEIDIEAGRILVDPDAAGLLDDGSEAQANEQPAPARKPRKPKQKPKSGGDGAA